MSQAKLPDSAILDPLTFALYGSRLIEASAGTGKTWTIASLYVRLVLGHGGSNAFARRLTPPEILVVTFTDAATKELRERIRARLREAAVFFSGGAPHTQGAAGDEFLVRLRAGYAREEWPQCAQILEHAAQWMDEAAVATIHEWCKRMLGEHAFDCGSLFTQNLESDQSDLLHEAVCDYWRSFFYPLGEDQTRCVAQYWTNPDALRTSVQPLLAHVDKVPQGRQVSQTLAEYAQKLQEIKAAWGRHVEELQAYLTHIHAKDWVHRGKLPESSIQHWMQALRDWIADPSAGMPDIRGTGWSRLSPEGVADAWKSKETIPQVDVPALRAFAQLRARIEAILPGQPLLQHATHWIAQRFADMQARRAQMGFDGLITQLRDALHGPNHQHLRAVIRSQFPVALIDEFQDTDEQQYAIFNAIYATAHNDSDSALVFIGDPKQAIYAFRGADIYTYLRAREATTGRHYTLNTNYRSSPCMVHAVNHVFQAAEDDEVGRGAFGFRNAQGHNPVPFRSAQVHGRKERLVVEGGAMPAALTFWCFQPQGETAKKVMDKGAYDACAARQCAAEILHLLRLGQQGKAGFGQEGQPLRPLRAADMAVLVNSGEEARKVRQALLEVGVRSVYLSGRQSVFGSPHAVEMQFWLAACAQPDDARLLRAALATPSLGLGWAQLDALNRDEAQWDARNMQFRHYLQCWRTQGVLPMLRHLLHDFGVPARLRGGRDGERALTDVLHLAEQLQTASSALKGEHALMRYLRQQCESAGTDNEAMRLRLESDAALVKVVTVHKSKGLEYPLVFVPFACNFRPVQASGPLRLHDAQNEAYLCLQPSAVDVECAEEERLGEDLRKLYVALTRACHHTWMGWAPLKNLAQSAPGYLLGMQVADSAALLSALQGRWGACEAIEFIASAGERAQEPPYRSTHEDRALLPERIVDRPRHTPWWIASYTALQQAPWRAAQSLPGETLPFALTEPQTASEEIWLQGYGEAQDEEAAREDNTETRAAMEGAGHDIHDFPRGAIAGNFLHALLEWVARQGFSQTLVQPEELRRQVQRRCNARGWQAWAPALLQSVQHWLGAPWCLPTQEGAAMCLRGLDRYQVEMEFLFAAHHVRLAELDAVVREHTAPDLGAQAALRAPLQRGLVNGMLKGFVDLVCVHQGRYYVVDYKSNRLGDDATAYAQQALQAVIAQHRYDLQYVLYCFALHRLLRARLPGYDYERDVGGAVYLFLRGISPQATPGNGVFFSKPPLALITAMERLLGRQTPVDEENPLAESAP